MIVTDASALLELLLNTPRAGAVAGRVLGGEALAAPHLLDVEIAQVLRRYVAQGIITAGRAETALADLADLPIRRHGHDLLLPRIWALRHNLTAYDAAYVALAEALDAELLTADLRLAAASGHGARVVAIAA